MRFQFNQILCSRVTDQLVLVEYYSHGSVQLRCSTSVEIRVSVDPSEPVVFAVKALPILGLTESERAWLIDDATCRLAGYLLGEAA
jgi:hypothetical protein